MNKAKIKKIVNLTLSALVLTFVGGFTAELSAQVGRDPFQKNPVLRKRDAVKRPRPVKTSTQPTSAKKSITKPKKQGPYVVDAPSAEARINYFRQVREQAALNGMPLPKPTSVMLLDELSVTGIFRTPRGYAAIVKVEPINLSYTIYPGERFFDGQLVAVEENRLVFRKVTKWSTGKFVSSVENKALRKYSDSQAIQGTAPPEAYSRKPQVASAEPAKKDTVDVPVSGEIVSPLEEMRKADEKTKDSAKDKSKGKKGTSKSKKSSKVARKKN